MPVCLTVFGEAMVGVGTTRSRLVPFRRQGVPGVAVLTMLAFMVLERDACPAKGLSCVSQGCPVRLARGDVGLVPGVVGRPVLRSGVSC